MIPNYQLYTYFYLFTDAWCLLMPPNAWQNSRALWDLSFGEKGFITLYFSPLLAVVCSYALVNLYSLSMMLCVALEFHKTVPLHINPIKKWLCYDERSCELYYSYIILYNYSNQTTTTKTISIGLKKPFIGSPWGEMTCLVLPQDTVLSF